MTRSIISTTLITMLASLVSSDAHGIPTESQRYPFDPACAWGRISNGRGLFVRCLTREESERLSKSNIFAAAYAQTGKTASAAQEAPKPGISSIVATPAPGSTTSLGPPAATTSRPAAATPPAEVSPSPTGGSEAARDVFAAELVSVTADDGELPLAKRKLAAPLDRYAMCVADHGGLKAAVGQVEVRFLVRERGRAEGVSTEKFQGMSEAAALCIAQVIDRRPTGAPAAPVVGATAIIRVRKRAGK